MIKLRMNFKGLYVLPLMACLYSSNVFCKTKQQILTEFDNSLGGGSLPVKSKKPFTAINSSVTTPTAEGSTARGYFVALAYIRSWKVAYQDSPAFLIGTSFGNSKKNVGVTLSLSSSLIDKGALNLRNHGVSLRLNRYLTKNISAALGVSNLVGIGQFRHYAHSFYGVLTGNIASSFMPIKLSVGVGSGAFNSALDAMNHNDKYFSAFYNIGIGLSPKWSLMADWNAQSLALGTTFIFNITKKIPIAMTIGLLNVAGTLPEGVHRDNVVASIAYGDTY